MLGFIILGIGGAIVFNSKCSKKQSINTPNNVGEEEVKITAENIPDEFLELELTYLGSAKVKENSTLLKEEQECAVHADITKDYTYTYSYRLFSSKEEYENLEKECGFYNEDFKIRFKEGKMFVCSYGKKLQWMKYNPSWKAPSGGLVNRAGFSGGPTVESELAYEEGGMKFTNTGYWTITSRDTYELYVDLCEVNEDDLNLEIREGKGYIFSWGKDIKSLQFNPAHKDRYGGLMNRVVMDWDMERKDELLFFYEYNYDTWIGGWLADMSIEAFD